MDTSIKCSHMTVQRRMKQRLEDRRVENTDADIKCHSMSINIGNVYTNSIEKRGIHSVNTHGVVRAPNAEHTGHTKWRCMWLRCWPRTVGLDWIDGVCIGRERIGRNGTERNIKLSRIRKLVRMVLRCVIAFCCLCFVSSSLPLLLFLRFIHFLRHPSVRSDQVRPMPFQ